MKRDRMIPLTLLLLPAALAFFALKPVWAENRGPITVAIAEYEEEGEPYYDVYGDDLDSQGAAQYEEMEEDVGREGEEEGGGDFEEADEAYDEYEEEFEE